MEIITTQKYIRMSPKKIRELLPLLRKKNPQECLDVLPFINKRASGVMAKAIKAAVSNAVNRGATPNSLTFKEIQIVQGPVLKRGRPVSRGRWHPIKKQMSHIRIVLTSKEQVVVNKAAVSKKVGVDKGLRGGKIQDRIPKLKIKGGKRKNGVAKEKNETSA